jgi:hypothetical protein
MDPWALYCASEANPQHRGSHLFWWENYAKPNNNLRPLNGPQVWDFRYSGSSLFLPHKFFKTDDLGTEIKNIFFLCLGYILGPKWHSPDGSTSHLPS